MIDRHDNCESALHRDRMLCSTEADATIRTQIASISHYEQQQLHDGRKQSTTTGLDL